MKRAHERARALARPLGGGVSSRLYFRSSALLKRKERALHVAGERASARALGLNRFRLAADLRAPCSRGGCAG